MARKQSVRSAFTARRRAAIAKGAGFLVLFLGVLHLLALFTYRADSGGLDGLFAGVSPALIGELGQAAAARTLAPLGWIGVWIVPVFLIAAGWNRARAASPRAMLVRGAAGLPAVLFAMGLAAAAPSGVVWGGELGAGLWGSLRGVAGSFGGALILLVLVFGSFLLALESWDAFRGRITRAVLVAIGRGTRGLALGVAQLVRLLVRGLILGLVFSARSLARFLRWSRHAVPAGFRAGWSWFAERFLRGMAEEAETAGSPPPLAGPAPDRRSSVSFPAAAPGTPAPPTIVAPVVERAPAPAAAAPPREPSPPLAETPAPLPEEPVVVRRIPEGIGGEEDFEGAVQAGRRAARPRGAVPKALFESASGDFDLPGTDLLDDVPEIGPPVPETELVENSRILTETLRDFGVAGRVGEVHPGPVITRYEFTPGPGVRVAQILNRADDLALKLRAARIRIVAPIPGKAAVGIEVPNHRPVTIYLRGLLESTAFRDAPGPLSIALGKDINGYPMVTELTKMPHLLIAGTTGSGKSVCVNGIITSLLMKCTPRDLRLLMVDPKMLELPMYNGIPHLLTDVVTDPRLAARSLKWLLLEMERRYRVLAARGSRNIQSYNAKLEKEGPVQEGEERLPFIVVLIDELADLMMTSGNEVEEPIARLAQTARAVGIHLIVATQRPSVDVLTGVIKANFPSRIAFQVASRTDSRTILDQNGAESLLGRGDMLFLPPAHSSPIRVHGAFVSEAETQRLVASLREQGKPEADLSLEEALAEAEGRAETDLDDTRFEDAARLVVAAGQGSASLLQRRLKVGYARAGRLVDMLESAGILAPADGSKPRDVLMDAVQLEKLLADREAATLL